MAVTASTRAQLAKALGLPDDATPEEILAALRTELEADGNGGDDDERQEMAELVKEAMAADPSLSWSAAYAKAAAANVVLAERVGTHYRLGELSARSARLSTPRELLERAGYTEAKGTWTRSGIHGELRFNDADGSWLHVVGGTTIAQGTAAALGEHLGRLHAGAEIPGYPKRSDHVDRGVKDGDEEGTPTHGQIRRTPSGIVDRQATERPYSPGLERELSEIRGNAGDPRLALHELVLAELRASGSTYHASLARVKATAAGKELVEKVAVFNGELMGRP